jgi:hypothetical protein
VENIEDISASNECSHPRSGIDMLNEHSSRHFQLKETVFSSLFAVFPRGYSRVLREFQILPRSSARSAE